MLIFQNIPIQNLTSTSMAPRAKQHRFPIKSLEQERIPFIGVPFAQIRMRRPPPRSRQPSSLAASPGPPIGSFARFTRRNHRIVNFPAIPSPKRICRVLPCPVLMDWLVPSATESSVPAPDYRRTVGLAKLQKQNPPTIHWTHCCA